MGLIVNFWFFGPLFFHLPFTVLFGSLGGMLVDNDLLGLVHGGVEAGVVYGAVHGASHTLRPLALVHDCLGSAPGPVLLVCQVQAEVSLAPGRQILARSPIYSGSTD